MPAANEGSKFELKESPMEQTDLTKDIERLRSKLRIVIDEMQCCEQELKQLEEEQSSEPRY